MLTLFNEMRFRILHSCFVVTQKPVNSFIQFTPQKVRYIERISMAQRCSTNETKNAHQHPKSNQMRKLFRFIQVTNCLFLHRSHHYKFVFGDFVRRPFKHTYAKQATTANAFARFCIELQCFCCGRPPSPKSKRSTIIAGNIVRSTNECVM